MTRGNFQQPANFAWSVADLLHGPYRPPQYERVMLPLTVLRCFDAVLESLSSDRMELYEELFADYINKPELQDLVSDWLGSEVCDRLGGS